MSMLANDSSQRSERPMRVSEIPLRIDLPEDSFDAPKVFNVAPTPPVRESINHTIDTFPGREKNLDPRKPEIVEPDHNTSGELAHKFSQDAKGLSLRHINPDGVVHLRTGSETSLKNANIPTNAGMRIAAAREELVPAPSSAQESLATIVGRTDRPPDNPNALRDIIIGVCLIVGASAAFVAASYVFKSVAKKYKVTSHELLYVRGLNSLIYSVIGSVSLQVPLFSHTKAEVILIFWRTLFSTVNTILCSVALITVEVSLMSVLSCAMPLLVALLARLIIGEPIFLGDIICIIIGLIGVMMVCKQPAAIFGTFEDTSSNFYVCLILLLIAIVSNAFFNVVSRRMKGAIHYLDVATHYGFVLTIVESFIIYAWQIKTTFKVEAFFAMMGVHTLNYSALCAFHYAGRYLSATNMSFTTFLQALGSVIGDLIIGVAMDKFDLIGTCVLIGSGLIMTLLRIWRERRAKAAAAAAMAVPTTTTATHR